MREIHGTRTLKPVKGYEAYILTAEGAPSSYASLYDYLCDAAGRPIQHHIRPQLTNAHSNPDSFCAKLLQWKDDQPGQIKKHQKLLTGGSIKDWPLTAVGVLPGEWRFYLINRTYYRRYQAAIKRFRQENPEHRCRTDLEIAAIEKIASFCEVLLCRAANPELADGTIVSVNLDVPRYLGAGTDVYTIGLSATHTSISEPTGLGRLCMKFPNDADPQEYIAETIDIQ